ncbi:MULTISPECIES: ribonuclease HII [unclassified Treponema]|uniref:ribonuclease HII n=1 Tax=unclassified Treponema TaxID=2638727 RepID=UPI0009DF177D|nr:MULTISPECIES: ribonuclease HII [unclassified Treponema]UTC51869.1 ribonuclease HII [Treponema sp. OMZ 855]
MLFCGIDEAGRGALAGPVYAAAVILPDTFDISILDDSKKLSPKRREMARAAILDGALYWQIASVPSEQIDKINILQATLTAMKQAFETLFTRYRRDNTNTAVGIEQDLTVIVDGNQLPNIGGNFTLIAEPKADGRYPCVMAASILAKTERDHCMMEYHKQYPLYRYDLHKGYGTQLHRSLIGLYGASPIQRQSFKFKKIPANLTADHI